MLDGPNICRISKRKALNDYICSAFSHLELTEILDFLSDELLHVRLRDELPPQSLSLNERAGVLVDLVERHRILLDFFVAMVDRRPRARAEINALAGRFGFDLAAEPARRGVRPLCKRQEPVRERYGLHCACLF